MQIRTSGVSVTPASRTSAKHGAPLPITVETL